MPGGRTAALTNSSFPLPHTCVTGVELYSDLCLADALLHYGLADEVVFHGKPFPWFVSDVTRDDFDETLAICLAEAPAGAQASSRVGGRRRVIIRLCHERAP